MIAAIFAFSVVLTILLVTLLVLVSASEDKEGAIASKAKHWLNKVDVVFPMILVLSSVTAGIAFSLFLNLYEHGKEGRDNYFSNIAVELGGIAYELLIVGIAFAWYERRKKRIEDEKDKRELAEKERTAEIAKLRALIDKYIPLKNDQAKVEILQAVKRLNEFGEYDINLNQSNLTVIDLSKNDNNIHKIIVRGGRFTNTKFDGLNLHESEFTDCVASDFSFSNGPEIEAARSMFMRNVKFDRSYLQRGNFSGAYLNGASFKDVIFSGKTNFEGADLKNVNFEATQGSDFSWHEAIVGEEFLNNSSSWGVDRKVFFCGVVLINLRAIIKRENRSDIRTVYRLLERDRFESLEVLLYKAKPFRYAILDADNPVWIDPLKKEE